MSVVSWKGLAISQPISTSTSCELQSREHDPDVNLFVLLPPFRHGLRRLPDVTCLGLLPRLIVSQIDSCLSGSATEPDGLIDRHFEPGERTTAQGMAT
jgi:hypothetical protein